MAKTKLQKENELLKKRLSVLGDTKIVKRLQKSIDSLRKEKPLPREKLGL